MKNNTKTAEFKKKMKKIETIVTAMWKNKTLEILIDTIENTKYDIWRENLILFQQHQPDIVNYVLSENINEELQTTQQSCHKHKT